ncbi:protein ORF129 [Lake sturgeon herpesvirus]|nr:protein ORF129 [Lake sturgeon herpesvirus]
MLCLVFCGLISFFSIVYPLVVITPPNPLITANVDWLTNINLTCTAAIHNQNGTSYKIEWTEDNRPITPSPNVTTVGNDMSLSTIKGLQGHNYTCTIYNATTAYFVPKDKGFFIIYLTIGVWSTIIVIAMIVILCKV